MGPDLQIRTYGPGLLRDNFFANTVVTATSQLNTNNRCLYGITNATQPHPLTNQATEPPNHQSEVHAETVQKL